MNRKSISILLLLIVGVIVAYLLKTSGKNSTIDIKTSNNKMATSLIQVNADIAAFSIFTQNINSTAILSAIQKGEIISEISTKVGNLSILEGQWVDAGDTLVILNDELFNIELNKTRGDFFKALTEFISELKLTNPQKAGEWNTYLNRAVKEFYLPPLPNTLSQSKFISIVRYNLHNFYAQVKQSEQKLKHCMVTAPFAGIVSNIKVYKGASVSPGTVLLTLTDLSKMQVDINILDKDLQHIHIGTPFQFIGNPTDTFYVSAIHPEIDPKTYSGKAIAVIPNGDMKYKDGHKVMVKIVKQIYKDRLIIPRSAILTRNDRDLVFVVKNGIAKWQYIVMGVGNSDFVEITKGVAVGDTVVTGGHYSLAHDVQVIVKMNR